MYWASWSEETLKDRLYLINSSDNTSSQVLSLQTGSVGCGCGQTCKTGWLCQSTPAASSANKLLKCFCSSSDNKFETVQSQTKSAVLIFGFWSLYFLSKKKKERKKEVESVFWIMLIEFKRLNMYVQVFPRNERRKEPNKWCPCMHTCTLPGKSPNTQNIDNHLSNSTKHHFLLVVSK